MKNREVWIFLFFAGLLFFNWPFLDIFSLVLPYYLFGLWAFLIVVIAGVAGLKKRRGGDADV